MRRPRPYLAIALVCAAVVLATAAANAACTAGEIRWTATYVYLCSATDTWVRAALATWP